MNPPSHAVVYRPDIDGLRAVAVGIVLGYHFFPGYFPGGFVGVDVFFVVSGFLITKILAADEGPVLDRLRRFYIRRIKRIFPALLCVVSVSLIAGRFLLLVDELGQLGKHAAASLAFTSNLVFWREAGYFDAAAETRPLLHLWSLGIEEQFYFAWPLLVVLAQRLGWRIASLAGSLAVVSFLFGAAIVGSRPTEAFYSPFPRAWELLLGAVISTLSPMQRSQPCRTLSNLLSWGGLGMIALATFLFGPSTSFPGYFALAPTLGALLLLLSGPSAISGRHFLASPPMVALGRRSYSLYLWHWPPLALSRVLWGETPGPAGRLALALLALALAWGSYRWVEAPLRRSEKPRLVTMLLTASVLVATIGMVLWGRGYQMEWGTNALSQVSCPLSPAVSDDWREPICRLSHSGPPRAVVWGDSHAKAVFAGLSDLAPHEGWQLVLTPGCPPVKGIQVSMTTGECGSRPDRALTYILGGTARTVILVFQSAYVEESVVAADYRIANVSPAVVAGPQPGLTRTQAFLHGLGSAISALEANGFTVLLLEDQPAFPFLPRDCFRRNTLGLPPRGPCRLPRSEFEARRSTYDEVLRSIRSEFPRVVIVPTNREFCASGECVFSGAGRLEYRDSHHLNALGGRRVATRVLEALPRRGERATN